MNNVSRVKIKNTASLPTHLVNAFHFDRFSKSGRTFVHKNLALSMIFAQVIFLFGINKTGNKVGYTAFLYTLLSNKLNS